MLALCRGFKRRTYTTYAKFGCVAVFVTVLFYFLVDWYICSPIHSRFKKPKFVCMDFKDRLANQMFQYAFAFSVAKQFDRDLIVPEESMLTKYFDIEPNTMFFYDLNKYSCRCFTRRVDPIHCAYDPENVNIAKDQNIAYEGYFQSWKYFEHYEKEVRQSFTFLPHISKPAMEKLKDILKSKRVSPADGTVLVGVHVRHWEEYYNPIIGKNPATKSYVINALNYFRQKYKKVLFIVGSNSPKVAREMLDNRNDSVFLEGNPPAVDMAILTKTNHTIMTVGSFGWFIGWLTGGTTIYYKYPDAPGSKYATQFHPGKKDHFYPGWIGME